MKSAYQALSASVSKADLSKTLELASKTAVAGFSEQDVIIKGLASTVNTYGKDTISYD